MTQLYCAIIPGAWIKYGQVWAVNLQKSRNRRQRVAWSPIEPDCCSLDLISMLLGPDPHRALTMRMLSTMTSFGNTPHSQPSKTCCLLTWWLYSCTWHGYTRKAAKLPTSPQSEETLDHCQPDGLWTYLLRPISLLFLLRACGRLFLRSCDSYGGHDEAFEIYFPPEYDHCPILNTKNYKPSGPEFSIGSEIHKGTWLAIWTLP